MFVITKKAFFFTRGNHIVWFIPNTFVDVIVFCRKMKLGPFSQSRLVIKRTTYTVAIFLHKSVIFTAVKAHRTQKQSKWAEIDDFYPDYQNTPWVPMGIWRYVGAPEPNLGALSVVWD